MSLFVIFKFPAVPSPVRPDACRGRNPDDRCRHPPRTLSGTLQEGHRGSAGQGKRTDPGAAPHGKPECSSGLPRVVLNLYPELHSGIPPGRLQCILFGVYLLKLESPKSDSLLHRNQSASNLSLFNEALAMKPGS
ncbi:unnamed protein product [Staurois parvus]|uniref:Uncharacterized protein n=1 Tax=Staurois parvus TaxID=386267 RepID=A0ABN9BSD0_9NEOB|nr:unnamed protein product [Staurois parvus]